ncbi:GFA family protein [Wenxinia marina]|uniref:CENP-V/GFA domain-containing protein n=1 Tax=Wenxinia marina DSM 24838 TaxID=1123501 RepID=A0A0D0NNP4_9RHOB|nr:DUF6151 family protein [Wenxinia marina]KIQ69895.1 hypothetical protein Wenmar_01465 [Wenxinia marina DSM 24838]GGL62055.1 hypothetical protein GCM10011392_15680 [Wenxinia marina]
MRTTELACACGTVSIVVEAAPIMVVECLCTSCRTAAERIESRPGAPAVRSASGGTPHVMMRKDRFRVTRGEERLAQFRLTPDSATRRVVATCCNSFVFLEFEKGHWIDLNAGLWPDGARPAVTERTMAKDHPAPVPDDGVPTARGHGAAFMLRLIAAWVRMGFRAPKMAAGRRELRDV